MESLAARYLLDKGLMSLPESECRINIDPIGKFRLSSRIKSCMYVWSSTMYERATFICQNWRKENITVTSRFSPIKIHYSEYPKRINEVFFQ